MMMKICLLSWYFGWGGEFGGVNIYLFIFFLTKPFKIRKFTIAATLFCNSAHDFLFFLTQNLSTYALWYAYKFKKE